MEVVRPLIRARREDVRAHVERHRLRFATDPSNADPRFLRVRVRREVIPLLESIAPGVVGHVIALADQLAEAAQPPTLFPLPRSTQLALEALLRSRSTTARVWLPGGLVVTLDPRARPGPRESQA